MPSWWEEGQEDKKKGRHMPGRRQGQHLVPLGWGLESALLKAWAAVGRCVEQWTVMCGLG